MATFNPRSSNCWAALVFLVLMLVHVLRNGLDLVMILMPLPLIVFLIPALDSLQGVGTIRVWNRNLMRFEQLERLSSPTKYWLNLLISWPAATVFGAFMVMVVPK